MPNARRNERDELGWRIPREGTLSHKIYLLMKAGVHPREIAERLGVRRLNVSVLAHRIRNPDDVNAYAAWYYRQKNPRQAEVE